tara:strand:+ start:1064 stop:1519 length:456 start_codon:yes stop_codon:yes gene_type:complete
MLKAPKIKKKEPKSSLITQAEAQQIARRIKKLTDIDIFHKTRKQEYVYVRSVFNHTLNKVFTWGLSRIAQLYNQNGYKNYDHATVWHSLNMFDLYIQYEPTLMDLYEKIGMHTKNKNALRVLIHNKLKGLSPEQLEAINTLADTFYKDNEI